MQINDEIVRAYLSNAEPAGIRNHWVYRAVIPGAVTFSRLPYSRAEAVRDCYEKILSTCASFKMYNETLARDIFGDIAPALEDLNVLLTVHIPQPYDAMVRNHNGEDVIIIDIGNFCGYAAAGYDAVEIARNLLTHELVHVLVHSKCPPPAQRSYRDELDYLAFDEGFAHALSFKDDIAHFNPGEDLAEKFECAKQKLLEAINENDPERRKQFIQEADAGKFWDKYASIASMIYLMRNLGSLKAIFEKGWRGYCGMVAG